MGKVKAAIRQSKPFGTPAEEAFVTLLHTTDALQRNVAALLKEAGLTLAQYNVLRILRGAGSAGLPCGEIAARMLTRDPDMTRLLDRLVAQGLVVRSRQADDRRVVSTRISELGLQRIAPLDDTLAELHRRQLGHLGDQRLLQLTALLDAAREGAASTSGSSGRPRTAPPIYPIDLVAGQARPVRSSRRKTHA